MSDEKRFVTIPENVLYHKKIPASAKLLFGEIAYICTRDGYCLKRNNYFADLFDVSITSVSLWIKSLQKNKLIQCRIKRKYLRVIFLQGVDKKFMMGVLKNLKGVIQKLKDNTTYYEQGQLDTDPANKDDFDIEETEWTDKDGKKHKRVSIDYGYGEEGNSQ